MRSELQQWLDGEIAFEAIPEELRPEAARLRALLDTPRMVGPAPSWIESRVMAEIPRTRPSRVARLLDRALQPRTVRVRPVTVAALAVAVLAGLLLWPGGDGAPLPSTHTDPAVRMAGTAAEDGRIYVQFVYVAPEASAVAVAGDFNGWSEASFELRDPDGDGVWTGHLPLSPGLHKYMFVVDGEWRTDPLADRHVDDGFGNRNAMIDVAVNGSAT
jgi:hypothetical protein